SKIIFIFSSLYTNERNPGIRVTTKAIISNKHNRSINKIVRSFMTFHHQYQYPFVPVFEIVRKERHFFDLFYIINCQESLLKTQLELQLHQDYIKERVVHYQSNHHLYSLCAAPTRQVIKKCRDH